MIAGVRGEGALMERGPLALFGAIVAVGLGPAMWLGAQFGHVTGTPSNPPAVTVQQDQGRGGVGAAAPDQPDVIKTKPKSNVEPLISATPKPHKSSATPSASASASPSESTPSGSPTPSTEKSTPPTDSTTDPPSGGSGGSGGGDQGPPPSPPTVSDSPLNDLSSAI
jgi:hypothetical protein